MCHCFRRKSSVNRIGLLCIIAHAHRFLSVLVVMRHGIPDKFPAGCPRKVAHIVSFVDPCFGAFDIFIFLCLLSFIKRDDLQWFSGSLCKLPAVELSRRKHLLVIEAFTRRTDYMVFGNSHFDNKIAEAQGKLSTSDKLLVLPPCSIIVHT